MKYVYGPVPSRRLGFSLGIDLLPAKECSFNCIYCQLGRTRTVRSRRFEHVDLKQLQKELQEVLSKKPHIDFITLAGSGEPTLHKGLDKIVALIKTVTHRKYPVCLITNASLLYRKEIRQELADVDVIIPSLDAVSADVFRKINRPASGITIDKVIEGLVKLRKEFTGKIWVEIMVIRGVNDSVQEMKKIKQVLQRIKPDRIQLNVPIRSVAADTLMPTQECLQHFKQLLCDIAAIDVASQKVVRKQKKQTNNIEARIMRHLQRRPATYQELAVALGIGTKQLRTHIQALIQKEKLKERTVNNRKVLFMQ